MVRSTMLMTDETGIAGVPPARLAYTAFGEPVTYDAGSQTWRVGFPAAGGTRYGYAGGFGYESGLITLQGVNPALPPVTLQHVGERWYDPAIGRFVQRDPIGIDGGMNTYTYCSSNPGSRVDPTGLRQEKRYTGNVKTEVVGVETVSSWIDSQGVFHQTCKVTYQKYAEYELVEVDDDTTEWGVVGAGGAVASIAGGVLCLVSGPPGWLVCVAWVAIGAGGAAVAGGAGVAIADGDEVLGTGWEKSGNQYSELVLDP